MAPKVDMKRSMTSHRTWVNDAIKRAEKFMGDNPDGLITSGDQEATKELIEEIKEKFASMAKKWTDVFVPQLEVEDPDKLLVAWDSHVHDISNQAKNTIDELRKALKIFETQGTVAGAASTTVSGSKRALKVDTLFLFLFLAQVEMNLLELLSIGNRDPVILIGILTLARSLE